MKKIFLILILLLLAGIEPSFADAEISLSSGVAKPTYKSDVAKLFRPNSVVIGEKAEFKVETTPMANVKLVMDYGYEVGRKVFVEKANIYGICTFKVGIPLNNELVGKSVLVEAFILDENAKNIVKKVVAVDANGKESMYTRVYIASNKSAKGFYLSPSTTLNNYFMNNDFDEESGYDPLKNQMYGADTPVTIRNMRDAQDNVK